MHMNTCTAAQSCTNCNGQVIEDPQHDEWACANCGAIISEEAIVIRRDARAARAITERRFKIAHCSSDWTRLLQPSTRRCAIVGEWTKHPSPNDGGESFNSGRIESLQFVLVHLTSDVPQSKVCNSIICVHPLQQPSIGQNLGASTSVSDTNRDVLSSRAWGTQEWSPSMLTVETHERPVGPMKPRRCREHITVLGRHGLISTGYDHHIRNSKYQIRNSTHRFKSVDVNRSHKHWSSSVEGGHPGKRLTERTWAANATLHRTAHR